MTRKGYILIELLVACTLLSIVGAGLYSGLAQTIKADRTIWKTSALYDPLKILWMRAGKDLRNTVSLRDYKFIGGQDELIFPSSSSGLFRVHYFLKDGKLLRSEEKLPEKFVKASPVQTVLLKGVKQVRFEYPYLDQDQRLTFRPLWTEEPYFGIPKAVKMDIKLKASEKTFSRLIPIPQGRWGHDPTTGEVAG